MIGTKSYFNLVALRITYYYGIILGLYSGKTVANIQMKASRKKPSIPPSVFNDAVIIKYSASKKQRLQEIAREKGLGFSEYLRRLLDSEIDISTARRAS